MLMMRFNLDRMISGSEFAAMVKRISAPRLSSLSKVGTFIAKLANQLNQEPTLLSYQIYPTELG